MAARPPHDARAREPYGLIALFLALPLAATITLGTTRGPVPAAGVAAPVVRRAGLVTVRGAARRPGNGPRAAPILRSDARPRR